MHKLREIYIDYLGRKVVLSGQHAFEWSITIYSSDRIIRFTFTTGREARKAFFAYKRKK